MSGSADAKFERLTNLFLELLYAERPLTLDELARRVAGYPEGKEARRQAFERDKRSLREEGIPVETSQVPGEVEGVLGYRISRSEAYLDLRQLDPDEMQALRMAVAAVRVDGLGGFDPGVKIGDLDDHAPLLTASIPADPRLAALHDASRRRAPVTFTYNDAERTVDAYALVFRFGFWYLLGRDHAAGDVRNFRVDRIAGDPASGDGGAYERPADFDVDAHFPSDPLLIGEGAEVEARVRVDADHAARVIHEVGEDAVVERHDDGSVVVALRVVNRAAFRSWLFGLLDHAEVVGPDELRSEVVAWLDAVLEGAS